jgi:hypothetical protein
LLALIEKKVKDALVYNININTTTYEVTCEDTSELMSEYYKSKTAENNFTGD